MELSSTQKRRYNRHLILERFGREGQTRLLQSKVLIVGVWAPSGWWTATR